MTKRADVMNVFRYKYHDYSRYVKANSKNKKRYNKVTPCGLTIKEIYDASKEPEFGKFAKNNKIDRRKSIFKNKEVYEKILFMRNMINNKKSLLVLDTTADRPYFRYKREKFKPLSPLLKWPGGKKNEIKSLHKKSPYLFPQKIRNFYEPFLGGGAFYFSVKVEKLFIRLIL